MNIITAFEELSLIPFCSKEMKKKFVEKLPNDQAKDSFLNGNQLSLRASLSSKDCPKFADAIDVVTF